jgi:hypothetical protein
VSEEHTMKQLRIVRVLRIIPIVIIAATVFGEVVMRLWNWLMPAIFGMRTLTFAQALGLLLLTKILFGGFHRHSGGRGWKRHMHDRWTNMTPEERERFRIGMRGWRECGFGRPAETTSETSV